MKHYIDCEGLKAFSNDENKINDLLSFLGSIKNENNHFKVKNCTLEKLQQLKERL